MPRCGVLLQSGGRVSVAENNEHDWTAGTVLAPLEPGPLPIIPKALWAEIQEWILAWKHADALRDEGLDAPGALLLYGPTGSGKTSLARAILKYLGGRPGCILEAHNVVTKMYGESPKNVARGFHLAEEHDALLVIEEIDAIGMKRQGRSDEENIKVTIALMRCLEGAKIPVIGTTNHVGHMDSALQRRFEIKVEVPTLDEKGRGIVLRKILGRDPEPELVALPLNDSIRIARRMRRREFLAACEEREKAA